MPRIPVTGDLWQCQIADYDPQPCRFDAKPNQATEYQLTKLMGSVRFTGTAEFPDSEHFQFTGEQFCPWGACDEPLDISFTWNGERGRFEGQSNGEPFAVWWDKDVAAAYGGAGYGGLTGQEQ